MPRPEDKLYLLITVTDLADDGSEETDMIVNWLLKGEEEGEVPDSLGTKSYWTLRKLREEIEQLELDLEAEEEQFEQEIMEMEDAEMMSHTHEYAENMTTCGAFICIKCNHHVFKTNLEVFIGEAVENGWVQQLARCHCGWAADGGDGYRQLVEMGETIEPDY